MRQTAESSQDSNPATGAKIADVADATREDVDAAVAAARQAFDAGKWPTMAASRRAKIVYKMSQLIAERASEIALLEVRDNGKSIATAKGELGAIVDMFEFYAGAATKNYGETMPPPLPTYLGEHAARAGRRRRCDRAVELSARARVVEGRAGARGGLHDRSQSRLRSTPLTAIELGKIAHRGRRSRRRAQRRDGFDAADRRVDGRASGHRQDRLRDRRQTGKSVAAEAAAQTLKRVTLELGGKSPAVVFDDADIEGAVAGALYGVYYNAGQCCEARSRILVQDGVYDRFVVSSSRRRSSCASAIPKIPQRRSARSRCATSIKKFATTARSALPKVRT